MPGPKERRLAKKVAELNDDKNPEQPTIGTSKKLRASGFKIIVIGPMGSGKTRFIMDYLRSALKESGYAMMLSSEGFTGRRPSFLRRPLVRVLETNDREIAINAILGE